MAKGFDTRANCASVAGSIKAAGYDFVARYLSKYPQKVIFADEAAQLKASALSIVLVYEDGPTAASYFTADRGGQDGVRAAQQAHLLDAPSGTTLYFAVDYDASSLDLANVVAPYFQAVNSSIRTFAAQSGAAYGVGVYGSGLVLGGLAAAGLTQQGWLAQSTGWRDSKTYTKWSIQQSLPATVCGLSVDPDVAVDGDYGAM